MNDEQVPPLPDEPGRGDFRRLVAERDGLAKANGKLMRKVAAVGHHTTDLITKTHTLRHEVRELEDLLAWVCRTEQPLEEIRRVIGERIPRRMGRPE